MLKLLLFHYDRSVANGHYFSLPNTKKRKLLLNPALHTPLNVQSHTEL